MEQNKSATDDDSARRTEPDEQGDATPGRAERRKLLCPRPFEIAEAAKVAGRLDVD